MAASAKIMNSGWSKIEMGVVTANQDSLAALSTQKFVYDASSRFYCSRLRRLSQWSLHSPIYKGFCVLFLAYLPTYLPTYHVV